MSDCVLQFVCDQSQSAFAFGETKPSLHFHMLTFINKVLRNIPGFIFLGSAQCRAGQMKAALLAVAEILSVSADLVCENPDGIMSLTYIEPFAMVCKLAASL